MKAAQVSIRKAKSRKRKQIGRQYNKTVKVYAKPNSAILIESRGD